MLAASGGKPAVNLLVAPEGERIPLPLGVDEARAFDHAVPREGWVAVQVGEQLVALVDGDLASPRPLGHVRRFIAPAADPSLVVALSDDGERIEPGDPITIQLVGPSGMRRSVRTSAWGLVGELRDGRVACCDALVSWDGSVEPLPAPGEVVAVLGGRFLVLNDFARGRLHLYDTATGERRSELLVAHFLSPVYNLDASAAALKSWGSREIVLATDFAFRFYNLGFEPNSMVWLGRDLLLAAGEREQVVLDVESGERTPITGLGRNPYPRVDVTGRFELDTFRASLAPAWKGPIPEPIRLELVAAARERLEAAAHELALPEPAIAGAEPAIRVRSCIPPKRIAVGASRLGGRPDLPAGRRWAMHGLGPMAFLGQFRLDEMAAVLPERGLPADGLVVVFAAVDDSGFAEGAHVEVVASDGLKRLAWPTALPDELRFDAALAALEPALSLPLPPLVAASDSEQLARLADLTRLPGPAHQLFGIASTIQDIPSPARKATSCCSAPSTATRCSERAAATADGCTSGAGAAASSPGSSTASSSSTASNPPCPQTSNGWHGVGRERPRCPLAGHSPGFCSPPADRPEAAAARLRRPRGRPTTGSSSSTSPTTRRRPSPTSDKGRVSGARVSDRRSRRFVRERRAPHPGLPAAPAREGPEAGRRLRARLGRRPHRAGQAGLVARGAQRRHADPDRAVDLGQLGLRPRRSAAQLRQLRDVQVADVVGRSAARSTCCARCRRSNPDRIGYVGWSAGANEGALVAASEPRVQALVLLSAGACAALARSSRRRRPRCGRR